MGGGAARPQRRELSGPMSVLVWVLIAIVVVGIVFAVFGWDRYRGARKAAGEGSTIQPTDEVFVDPESGRRMRVWYDRSTGRREYRPE
jgi:hypothetical protein